MQMRVILAIVAIASAQSAQAQSRPPIRELGKLERVTTDSLRSVSEAIHLPGGGVLVNDPVARRVLLLDSTLAHPMVVADTTDATGNAYGTHRGGTIMHFRGDSALYVDQASLTMFVISPTGKLGRIMAFPQPPSGPMTPPGGGQLVTGGDQGPPGFDARGRLVYYSDRGFMPGGMTLLADPGSVAHATGPDTVTENRYVDSASIYRVELATRRIDTAATVKLPKGMLRMRLRGGDLVAIENTFDPLPVIDQWAMLPDGTLAIVRGRDYHIDWIGSDGASTSTQKLPFDWERVTDDRKRALQDSVEQAWQARRALRGRGGPPPSGAGGRGGGGGGRGGDAGAPGGSQSEEVPNVAVRLPLDSIADYVPPFTRGAVRADAEGNVWIRTSTMKGDRPVYDVVNRNGEIVDRVQLPAFRTIAGFGPGVIYMAVRDPAASVRLERAHIR